ncbi:unnamed protein product [Prorocentrum cordatum]|uniref:alpha-L-rhamnosidase n=1 Tax=Prorocentrum cordatum TaxID=2364126 RepID=A0ABN9QWU3_9DINO|nr:unnamed protein product [Polarella glacialis]
MPSAPLLPSASVTTTSRPQTPPTTRSSSIAWGGAVTACGADGRGETPGAARWAGAAQVAAGAGHSLGLLKDGAVAACGADGRGQTSDVTQWRGAAQIAAGDWRSPGRLKGGAVAARGRDWRGETSRYVFQREFAWQRHSTQHNLMNPTWPTEWRQTIPLLAHDDFMKTGEVVIAQDHWEFLKSSSQAQCINTSSGLLDFSHCSRPSGVRDIVDWPQVARDGYQMTEVNTVINAFAVGALRALAVLANATGKLDEAVTLQHRASALSDAMADKLFDNSTGLFVDGQGSGADHHSAWHAQVFPLFFGAGLAEQNERLLAFLKSKRMAGSVYAAFAFLLGLYRRFSDDHGALALDLLTTCDGNSWCGMLSAGATAVMEAWTREEIGEAQPVLVAPVGVSPRHRHRAGAHGRPGLGARLQSEVRPQPGALAWAELKLPVLSGFIEVRVEQSASEFELTLVAPGNTQATACLPRLGGASAELVVDGRPRSGHASGDFLCVAGVGSGRHTIIRRARGGEVFV